MVKSKKLLLLIVALCTYHSTFCQELELSEEEFKEMSEFAYEMCKSIFSEKDYVYKKDTFEKEDFFEPTISSEVVDQLIEHIKRTGKLFIEDEGYGPQLVLALSFPPEMSDAFDAMDKLELEEMDIKDKNGLALKMGGFYQNHRSNQYYKFKAGLDKTSLKDSTTLKGNATYTFDLMVGYEQIELSKSAIGETFILNGCEIKLVDIIHNQLILEPKCEEGFTIKLINFAEKNFVYEPYAYDELLKMEEKDSTINTEGSFTQSSQTIDKKMYQIFKEDPNFTLKQFRKLLTTEEIIRLSQQADIYLILEHVAPIGDRFILFTPKLRQERMVIKY